MDMLPVCIEAPAVAVVIIKKLIRLGNQVDDVEAKSVDALFLPELDDVCKLTSNGRVVPVQICL